LKKGKTINEKSSLRLKEFFGTEDVRLDLEIQRLLDEAMNVIIKEKKKFCKQ